MEGVCRLSRGWEEGSLQVCGEGARAVERSRVNERGDGEVG